MHICKIVMVTTPAVLMECAVRMKATVIQTETVHQDLSAASTTVKVQHSKVVMTAVQKLQVDGRNLSSCHAIHFHLFFFQNRLVN